MNVYELIGTVGGEIVAGRARVRQGDKYIIVGRVTPEGMVMTPDGKKLADAQTAAKPARTPRKKAAAEDTPSKEEPSDEG